MGVQRTSFEKLQRERAKKAKAAAKRQRREDKATEEAPDADVLDAEDTETGDPEVPLSAAELLRLVEVTHARFEAGQIGFEEYEEKKAELLARLPVD
jgi:hypothetical protein